MIRKKIKPLLPGAVFIICVALVLYYFVNSILDYIYLKTDFAYTISASVSMRSSGKTGTDNKYTFYLNGKWYAGHTMLPLRREGTKYFIKFYPKNPNRNEATRIVADSEDVKNLPPDGYKKLPHQ